MGVSIGMKVKQFNYWSIYTLVYEVGTSIGIGKQLKTLVIIKLF